MLSSLAATSPYFRKDDRTGWEITRRDGTFRSRRTFRMKIEGGKKKLQLPRGKSPKQRNEQEENNNQRQINGMGKETGQTECTRTTSLRTEINNNNLINNN